MASAGLSEQEVVAIFALGDSNKDGNDFLLAKSSRGHLLLADHTVAVPVQLLEALLDLFQVLVGFAQSAHNGGGGRTHHSHKFAHVNFSIVVGVADGKDCLNLCCVEAASARRNRD